MSIKFNSKTIPGIRDINEIKNACYTSSDVLFLLSGNINDLKGIKEICEQNKKKLLVNIDLVNGIAKDKSFLEFLKTQNLCDGIITTKSNIINIAKKLGFITIQRVFVIDSTSLNSISNLIEKTSPDAYEVLPSCAAKNFIQKFGSRINVIAGGLIEDLEQVNDLIKYGVKAVSTSKNNLWL
ncbi:glycerol-3-phosphate responsive antiterminator [Geotoga petraea]|jgi:glycerol uptake operon antiterminator|uniref:Glycerol uptake operon antiterminator n=1 Tax=Geotoga petraea TaxID=28234 RepID=A0A1G6P8T4_9BACT|nr:glycerol-3-phosphate responsive antiterminator [Geotoga petraea]MDK2946471.1 glycerol uptake operon antiterminator [Geotoga sp.]TGG87926.1 glycerol-3-phosphate responsive antiterminator [Geotoga petraea]SDC75906.1 glycerol uptake operon antiterminator [Geotoga petraea]